MSLFSITFSSSETGEDYSDEQNNSSVLNDPIPLPSPIRTPKRTIKTYRDMTSNDQTAMQSVRSCEKPRSGKILMKIKRQSKTKLNGTRLYFAGFCNNEQCYLSKAKSITCSQIPITHEKEIHLRNKTSDGLLINSNNCDFILQKNGENQNELLRIHFYIPHSRDESDRLMEIQFMDHANHISKIESLEIIDHTLLGDDAVKSVKNAILGIRSENTPLIVIKKVSKDELIINSYLRLPTLILFSLGVASFIGKKPTK